MQSVIQQTVTQKDTIETQERKDIIFFIIVYFCNSESDDTGYWICVCSVYCPTASGFDYNSDYGTCFQLATLPGVTVYTSEHI